MSVPFQRLVLPQRAARLAERDIHEPTPIQIKSIPLLREGKDLIASSQTGTGKTLSYLLPLLDMVETAGPGKALLALIIVPTRELAMQIVGELDWLCDGSDVRYAALIGGASLTRQAEKLKTHPHLIVGTPGRIVELLKMRKLKLHQVQSIILDEADQIFALGAAEEVEQLLKAAPRDRQTAMFSATVTQELLTRSEQWMREPVRIDIAPEKRIPDSIGHVVVTSEARDKIEMLKKLIRAYNPRQAIIFVNETDKLEEVRAKLAFSGFDIAMLYGDTSKQERANVMKRFRDGKLQLLLATDVAARGLDIPAVTHIFHLDPAPDADHYVHRTGRTGRMGRKGTSVLIVSPKEWFIAGKFAKALGISFQHMTVYGGQVIAAESARSSQPPRRDNPKRHALTAAVKSEAVRTERGGKAKQESRDRTRKNKGAPKWLKEKASIGPTAKGPKPKT